MRISLITTVFNESANILIFLESYRQQTKYADEFIIVDGGSTDGTFQLIQDYALAHPYLNIHAFQDTSCNRKVVPGPIAKGRNVAIELASYDYIAVTDAGCSLDQNWLAEITKPFENKNVDVVSGWYVANIKNGFMADFAAVGMPKLTDINASNFLPSSRSVAFKKSCWKKVGGYPTATYTGEDTKFDLDLRKAGCHFSFAPRAIVLWDCPSSFREMLIKQYRYGKGDGALGINQNNAIKGLIHLIFPIRILMNSFSLKRKAIQYSFILATQFGYLAGILERISSTRSASSIRKYF